MRGAFVVLGESSTRYILGDDFAPFIQGGRRMRPDVLRRFAARTKSKLRVSEKKQPNRCPFVNLATPIYYEITPLPWRGFCSRLFDDGHRFRGGPHRCVEMDGPGAQWRPGLHDET